MLSIKVLGPGCYNCDRVQQLVIEALDELATADPNLEATVEHIEDPVAIQEYPILFTPGLVVNEKLVCAGRIPSLKEVKGWLQEALEGTSAR